MTSAEIIALAVEWSSDEPELCAQIAVALDRIVRDEREACAELMIDLKDKSRNHLFRSALTVAELAIRARGKP